MKPRPVAVLSVLVVFASLLLVYRLDNLSLWGDEVFSARVIRGSPAYMMAQTAADRHPPLYFLLLYLWGCLCGTTDFALRLLSVLLLVPSIPLVFYLGKRLYSDRVGLLSAALFALSPCTILWGRMVRYYSVVATLILIVVIAYLNICKKDLRSVRRWYLCYALSFMALAYTNYVAAGTVFIASNVFACTWGKKRGVSVWPWVVLQLCILISLLPLALVFFRQLSEVTGSAPGELRTGIATPFLTVGLLLYNFVFGMTVLPWELFVTLPVAVVALLSIGRFFAAGPSLSREPTGFWLPLCFLAISLAVAAIIPFFYPARSPVNLPAIFFFASPFFFIVLGAGVANWRQKRVQALLVLTLLAADGYALSNYYRGRNFINYALAVPSRQIVAQIEKQRRTQDVVVYWEAALAYYHGDDDRMFWLGESHDVADDFTSDRLVMREKDADDVEDFLVRNDVARVWRVAPTSDRIRSQAKSERLRSWLSAQYSLVNERHFVEEDQMMIKLKRSFVDRPVFPYKVALYVFEK